eukprot:6213102-Pleurochrysis_carterae.AAC.1
MIHIGVETAFFALESQYFEYQSAHGVHPEAATFRTEGAIFSVLFAKTQIVEYTKCMLLQLSICGPGRPNARRDTDMIHVYDIAPGQAGGGTVLCIARRPARGPQLGRNGLQMVSTNYMA